MVITFNELRRIKDKLPSGSSQRIADELGIDVDTVRNYFGGKHYDAKGNVGIHVEQGPDGGLHSVAAGAIPPADDKRQVSQEKEEFLSPSGLDGRRPASPAEAIRTRR